MKCVICRQGETNPGKATSPLERQGIVVVFTGLPAEICADCEAYTDEVTPGRLLRIFQDAVQAGVKVNVRESVAA